VTRRCWRRCVGLTFIAPVVALLGRRLRSGVCQLARR
jgi:hypothetical protein